MGGKETAKADDVLPSGLPFPKYLQSREVPLLRALHWALADLARIPEYERQRARQIEIDDAVRGRLLAMLGSKNHKVAMQAIDAALALKASDQQNRATDVSLIAEAIRALSADAVAGRQVEAAAGPEGGVDAAGFAMLVTEMAPHIVGTLREEMQRGTAPRLAEGEPEVDGE